MHSRASAIRSRQGALKSVVRHMSGKDVRFGNEARALMLAGVDKLADAVQVSSTLRTCLPGPPIFAHEAV